MPYVLSSNEELTRDRDYPAIAEALIAPMSDLVDGSVDGVLCATMFDAVPLLVELVRIASRAANPSAWDTFNAAVNMINASTMTPDDHTFGFKEFHGNTRRLGCWENDVRYQCKVCGSEAVYWTSTAYWDAASQGFMLADGQDFPTTDALCGDCGEGTIVKTGEIG